MDRADYDKEKRGIMNQIFKKKDYFFELRDNGKWTLSTDDAKAGVKISTQKTSN